MPKKTWKNHIRPILIDGDLAKIELQDGSYALIDADDIHLAGDWLWFALDNHKGVVVQRACKGKNERLADVINPPLLGIINDHRNGNPRDNRRGNLRYASSSNNAMNRRKASKHPYKGIAHRSQNSWRGQIRISGQIQYLGNFKTAEAAARAYDDAARLAFGEFAALNFPRAGETSELDRPHFSKR